MAEKKNKPTTKGSKKAKKLVAKKNLAKTQTLSAVTLRGGNI